MTSPRQRTIGKAVTLDGVGVHSGEPATMTLRPANPDTGIRFRRVDVESEVEIPAELDSVVRTRLGTTLGRDGVAVMTVEHVLAALVGMRVDNVVVEVDGPEVPIRDGSFRDFGDALRGAGLVEQAEEAKVVALRGAVCASSEGASTYVATPADRLEVSGTIDFDHPAIGRRFGAFVVDEAGFREELEDARTFGFTADAEALHAGGLALGASLDNGILLDDERVLSAGLRFADEFLRHKLGDLVGDLALLGARLSAHVVTERPSHAGNVELVREIQRHVRRMGPPVADTRRIMEFLPHRYPMLLVDRIIDFVPGASIVGIKNVTINEPFFQGHYPGHPVMPGVLIVEAMAQCGGLLLMDAVDDPEMKVVYFMTMDNVKFRKPVTPGDTLVFELDVLQLKRKVCRIAGRGLVDGQVVAEAEFMARIMDR